jgi:hypothetical protein
MDKPRPAFVVTAVISLALTLVTTAILLSRTADVEDTEAGAKLL